MITILICPYANASLMGWTLTSELLFSAHLLQSNFKSCGMTDRLSSSIWTYRFLLNPWLYLDPSSSRAGTGFCLLGIVRLSIPQVCFFCLFNYVLDIRSFFKNLVHASVGKPGSLPHFLCLHLLSLEYWTFCSGLAQPWTPFCDSSNLRLARISMVSAS